MKKNSTWVITGGAGFIGSHLAKKLCSQDQDVIIFDNFSSGNINNLSTFKNKIKIIKGDIRDATALTAAFKGADYVLHHAALVSVPESVEKPLETMQINVQGTANVLDAARQNNIKRVVFASSSAVYGNGTDLPYTEQSPVIPQSPYALSKYQGEQLCALYTQTYGLDTVALRYFNVFGPGQNANSAYAAVVIKFIDLILKNQPLTIDWDGLQRRDFISVHDIVNANIFAALDATSGQVYNVATGQSSTLLELADLIEQLSNRKVERAFKPKRAGDVKESSADITKITKAGFKPAVTLKDGLVEIIKHKQEGAANE